MTTGSDPARPPDPRDRGRWAEDLAFRYLRERGLVLIARNYRCLAGEIDLVMRQRDTLVFVEVRYRARGGFTTGAESIGATKRRRLIKTAEHYLLTRTSGDPPACRFDVVSVCSRGSGADIEWLQNAFEA